MTEYDIGQSGGREADNPEPAPLGDAAAQNPNDGELHFDGYRLVDDIKVTVTPVLLKTHNPRETVAPS
jgi:hypothetical protein